MDVLERDFYEERRRKWRRSAFWRGVLVTLGVLVLLGLVGGWAAGDLPRGDHIARFTVAGLITDDRARDDLLADIAEASEAKALIIDINSPGGTTAGSEALFAAIREVAAVKPVVAVIGEMAASGGYVAAIAADHIVGRGNSLTGSIGVIMEYPDLTGVMAKLGVAMQTVRSSELKAEPSPFRPTNPAARAIDEALVADSYGWFRGLVGERRDLSGNALDAVANGSVFTGRLALRAGLIDALGGEKEARDWLESRDASLASLEVGDWEVEEERTAVGSILGKISASAGILNEISAEMGPALYSIAR